MGDAADSLGEMERELARIGPAKIEAIAVVGPRNTIAGKLRARLAGIADGASLTHNRAPDATHWSDVVAELKRSESSSG